MQVTTSLNSRLAHLHHAGLHVHLVQRESLLRLVGSDLPSQGFHVTLQLPLEVLQRCLLDIVHQYVVLGFYLKIEKYRRNIFRVILILIIMVYEYAN